MNLNNPNEPVIVVTTTDGKLVHAGHPETFKRKLLGDYTLAGYNVSTITITEFRSKEWTWLNEEKEDKL